MTAWSVVTLLEDLAAGRTGGLSVPLGTPEPKAGRRHPETGGNQETRETRRVRNTRNPGNAPEPQM